MVELLRVNLMRNETTENHVKSSPVIPIITVQTQPGNLDGDLRKEEKVERIELVMIGITGLDLT